MVTCFLWRKHSTKELLIKSILNISNTVLFSIPWQFQLPSSYGLGVMMFWRFGGKGSIRDWIYEWMSDKGVCRTAPATSGLLMIFIICILTFPVIWFIALHPVQLQNPDILWRPKPRLIFLSAPPGLSGVAGPAGPNTQREDYPLPAWSIY